MFVCVRFSSKSLQLPRIICLGIGSEKSGPNATQAERETSKLSQCDSIKLNVTKFSIVIWLDLVLFWLLLLVFVCCCFFRCIYLAIKSIYEPQSNQNTMILNENRLTMDMYTYTNYVKDVCTMYTIEDSIHWSIFRHAIHQIDQYSDSFILFIHIFSHINRKKGFFLFQTSPKHV